MAAPSAPTAGTPLDDPSVCAGPSGNGPAEIAALPLCPPPTPAPSSSAPPSVAAFSSRHEQGTEGCAPPTRTATEGQGPWHTGAVTARGSLEPTTLLEQEDTPLLLWATRGSSDAAPPSSSAGSKRARKASAAEASRSQHAPLTRSGLGHPCGSWRGSRQRSTLHSGMYAPRVEASEALWPEALPFAPAPCYPAARPSHGCPARLSPWQRQWRRTLVALWHLRASDGRVAAHRDAPTDQASARQARPDAPPPGRPFSCRPGAAPGSRGRRPPEAQTGHGARRAHGCGPGAPIVASVPCGHNAPGRVRVRGLRPAVRSFPQVGPLPLPHP
eukprot:8007140-Alexandrium_andersonii.AAC.1